MVPLEHSTIFLTFIKLPFVIKTIVLSILSGRLRQVVLYSLWASLTLLETQSIHDSMNFPKIEFIAYIYILL